MQSELLFANQILMDNAWFGECDHICEGAWEKGPLVEFYQ